VGFSRHGGSSRVDTLSVGDAYCAGMPSGLFRTFHRDSRPLSQHLMSTYGQRSIERARTLASNDPDVDPESVVAQLLVEPRPQPPSLGGIERASVRDREGLARPTPKPGTKASTSRHYVAIELSGEATLLDHWPDQVEHPLEPIDLFDGDAWQRTPLGEPYNHERELARHEFLLAQDRWFVGFRDDLGQIALYTFLDLTDDEEQAVARGGRDLAGEVSAMRSQIEPIVAAIGEQTATFYDEVLPPLLREVVSSQQLRVRARRAVQENLSWPEGWKQREPVLDRLEEAATATAMAVMEAGTVEVHVTPPDVRLSGASYTDVLRTLRVWADAVERHPAAYAELAEDRISDLIVATLNAALPGAHREVYSRGGKSDLYIRADALSDGRGPAKVFIGECKWWNGPAVATGGLSQLFGYLETKDLAALLVLLVPLQNPAIARTGALEALSQRKDFQGQDETIVEGWPQLRFEHEHHTVRVCLAFVDLPR